LSYRPTAEEFEKPTPQLLLWLENSLSYYQQQGNEKAIAVFRDLLAEAKSRVTIITRSASSHNNEEEAIQRASDDAKYRRMNEAGFRAMLEAARPARTSKTAQPEPQIHFGFLRMLDSKYQAHVAGESVETHDRIPCGFGEMIAAAFPHGNPTTPYAKPHVRRGMGFANMLEGAAKGTE